MECPFTRRERRQLVDVCEWLHDGAVYEQGDTLPDGDDPAALMNEWRSWVEECLVLLDAEGRFRHLPYPGTYREQPDYDMQVLQLIRSTFNRLENAKIQALQAKARGARK